RGDRAMELEVEVVDVAPLGHGQAKVEGRAAYDVGRALRAEGPRLTARRLQFDAHGRVRHGETPRLIAVGQSPGADEGDMAQAVRRRSLETYCVGYVLAVGPCLH